MYARGGEQLKTIHGWGPRVNGVQTENKIKKKIFIYIYLIIVITELIITIVINKKINEHKRSSPRVPARM